MAKNATPFKNGTKVGSTRSKIINSRYLKGFNIKDDSYRVSSYSNYYLAEIVGPMPVKTSHGFTIISE